MRKSLLMAALVAASCLALAEQSSAGWRRDNPEQCAKIDERLQAIESERRIGYTPKRGRKLREAREKLEARR
ncbi:MAG: hypothetical protein FJ197_06235, partial [Gammaproteobacteria bacterium]|nr:hypothetical protein [Gammaproteobacteria bacterium]